MDFKTGFLVLIVVVVASGCVENPVNQSKDSNLTEKEVQGPIYEETVIRLSDLNGKYNFTAEINETREKVSASRSQKMKDKGVVRQYKRLFTREQSAEDVPYQIISTAIIYEDEESAESDLNSSLQQLREKGNVFKTSLSGVQVYKASWEGFDYNYGAIYYLRENKLYFLLSTETRSQSYDEKRVDLMKEMISDTI